MSPLAESTQQSDATSCLNWLSPKSTVSYLEFIQNEPRFRGLVKALDNDGGEVWAYLANEIMKRYEVDEQRAAGSGKSAGESTNK